VITVAARRPPNEVVRIVDALQYTDMPDEAAHLLRAVGAGPVGDVASVAHLLQRRPDELTALLDAALDTAQQRSSLIGLVNALWVAGLREEVDGLVERAVSRLPGPAIVSLADELREVGREEAAFGLYAGAADTVATRPPEVVAQLCQAMTSAGRTAGSERIAHALAGTAADVTSLLDVATAFWEAGLDDHADLTLTRAAAMLSTDDIMAMATALWHLDRDEAAHHLCLRAMVDRPTTVIQEIVTVLREMGRPVSARRLLETVVGQVPVRTVFELLTTSTDTDRQRILRKVVERERNEVAELLDTLSPAQPVLGKQLVDLIAATVTNRTDFLPIIIEHLDQETKEQLLTDRITSGSEHELVALLRELLADEANLLMFLIIQKGDPPLRAVIAQLREPQAGDADPVLPYVQAQPLDRFGPLLNGLREAGLDHYAEAVLRRSARRRSWDSIASDITFLFGADQADAGKQLLAAAFTLRNNGELKALVSALRRHSHPAALDAAASWVRTAYVGRDDYNIEDILRFVGLGEYARSRFGKNGSSTRNVKRPDSP
jgi:hypothetical protein